MIRMESINIYFLKFVRIFLLYFMIFALQIQWKKYKFNIFFLMDSTSDILIYRKIICVYIFLHFVYFYCKPISSKKKFRYEKHVAIYYKSTICHIHTNFFIFNITYIHEKIIKLYTLWDISGLKRLFKTNLIVK